MELFVGRPIPEYRSAIGPPRRYLAGFMPSRYAGVALRIVSHSRSREIAGQPVRAGYGYRRYSGSMTARPVYPSELSDARWALIEPRLTAGRQARTAAGVGGRVPSHDLREIVNAILYVNRTGIAGRSLPHDLPPGQTVYGYVTAWTTDGVFAQLTDELTGLARTTAGRRAEPSAGVIDTQSVKTSTNAPTATQGTDAGRRIVGRRRGIVTDTLGLLLAVLVTAAGAGDHTIGVHLLNQAKASHHALAKTWADAGFTTTVIEHGATLGIDVEVVAKDPHVNGFSVIKRRWVIERAFGWIMLHRRLARDDETRPDTSAAMIRIAMIDNLTRRITGESTPTWRDT
jgi:transposase